MHTSLNKNADSSRSTLQEINAVGRVNNCVKMMSLLTWNVYRNQSTAHESTYAIEADCVNMVVPPRSNACSNHRTA